MFFLIVILSAMAIITAVNYIFLSAVFGFGLWQIILYVTVSVVAVIAIDGLFAAIVRWCLPEKLFSADKKGFGAGRKERRFLEKIGVKKWKDKVPELGFFTGFRKNKIRNPKDNEYLARYIVEANYGVGVHISNMVFGFLVMLVFPRFWLNIGLPVAVVNFFLSFLPYAILRYNLPKLHTIYRVNAKRTAKTAERQEEDKTDLVAAAPEDKTA